MRVTPIVLVALFALALVPTPAYAMTSCSAAWSGSASCAFHCDEPTVSVAGSASFLGALANVQVTATCGVASGGVFVALFSVSCSGNGPGVASCASSAPNTFYPLNLTGTCVVTGSASGSFSCSSP